MEQWYLLEAKRSAPRPYRDAWRNVRNPLKARNGVTRRMPCKKVKRDALYVTQPGRLERPIDVGSDTVPGVSTVVAIAVRARDLRGRRKRAEIIAASANRTVSMNPR